MSNGSSTLKAQFDALQKRQKESLTRRNAAKKKEDINTAAVAVAEGRPTDDLDQSISHTQLWGISEVNGLELNLCDLKVTNSEVCESNNEEDDASSTIRELRDENGRLYKLLGEKDAEIKMIQSRWKDEKKELIGNSVGSENAAAKIISMSKKIRDLMCELEKERTKNRELKKQIDAFKQRQENENTEVKRVSLLPSNTDVYEKEELEQQIKTLQEKLKQATGKAMEYQNQSETMKKELKIAHKVLSNEIGDGISIQSLMNSTSSWRGRQQQIINLQNKVSELNNQVGQLKLHQQQQQLLSYDNMSSMSLSASAIGLTKINNQSIDKVLPLTTSLSVHEERHRSSLKRAENSRREAQEKLKDDLVVACEEIEKLKIRQRAAKSRNVVLSNELKQSRNEIKRLQEKSKEDDELVNASVREVESLREEKMSLQKKVSKRNKDSERIVYANDISPDKRNPGCNQIPHHGNSKLIDQLEARVKEQEHTVKRLEEELKNSQQGSKMIDSNEDAHHRNIEDKSYEWQKLSSLLEVASVERERLLELTQRQQLSIENSIRQHLELETKCCGLNRRNATLEKGIELAKKNSRQQQPPKQLNRSRGQSRSANVVRQNETENDDKSEAETRLLIQMDENNALKEALNSTLKSKQEDIKVYENILDQSKKIFMEGLRQLTQDITLSNENNIQNNLKQRPRSSIPYLNDS